MYHPMAHEESLHELLIQAIRSQKYFFFNKVTYTRLDQLRGNIHTNGVYKNNNNNNIQIFTGLNKKMQKTQTP